MTAAEELAADNARKVAARFFLRIGQAEASQPWRDEMTLPLFGLPLILEAGGMLAHELRGSK